jgi:hypothetical protein
MKKLFLLVTVLTVAMALQSTAQITTSTAQKNGAFNGTLPAATFAALQGGDITIAKMASTDSLGTTSASFRIASFSLKATLNGVICNIASTNSKINSDMKNVLTKQVVGNVFTFENIKARYTPAGSVHALPSISFTVK